MHVSVDSLELPTAFADAEPVLVQTEIRVAFKALAGHEVEARAEIGYTEVGVVADSPELAAALEADPILESQDAVIMHAGSSQQYSARLARCTHSSIVSQAVPDQAIRI